MEHLKELLREARKDVKMWQDRTKEARKELRDLEKMFDNLVKERNEGEDDGKK